jgi:hypothetical protein
MLSNSGSPREPTTPNNTPKKTKKTKNKKNTTVPHALESKVKAVGKKPVDSSTVKQQLCD